MLAGGSPHGVEECAVVNQPKQFVGSCHVVGDGFLSIVKKGIRSPYLTGQEVV